MNRKPLLPRGRIGRAVPIQPLDHETVKKPHPPTQYTHGELRAGIGLVLVLVCALLVWVAAEWITGFAR